METILIHSNGDITKKGKTIQESVLRQLGSAVCLEEHVTLGSFFQMVQKYPDLLSLSDVLDALVQIAANQDFLQDKTDEIDSLIFYKTIEIKGFPGKPSLNIYNSLKGVCNKKNIDLKFFHLETLLNHTLELGQLKHVVFGDIEDVFSYATVYTLFEFVEGISWGLSFNFNPLECSIRR